MNIDYTIKKLEEQKSKVNLGDLEVWLNTTYSYIEGYFKGYETRARNFSGLIHDYKMDKISSDFGTKVIDNNAYKAKALEYVNDCISYLNDLKKQQLEEAKQKSMTKKVKSFDEFNQINAGAKVLSSPPPEPKFDRRPLGLSLGLFWIIIVTVVGVAFFLGKFEEKWTNSIDKDLFRDQIKSLELKNDSLRKEIKQYETIKQNLNGRIESLEDTINAYKQKEEEKAAHNKGL